MVAVVAAPAPMVAATALAEVVMAAAAPAVGIVCIHSFTIDKYIPFIVMTGKRKRKRK
jgi:hypothetical protein